jgi:hypothetical protein
LGEEFEKDEDKGEDGILVGKIFRWGLKFIQNVSINPITAVAGEAAEYR